MSLKGIILKEIWFLKNGKIRFKVIIENVSIQFKLINKRGSEAYGF
jgi:hypothetical protein